MSTNERQRYRNWCITINNPPEGFSFSSWADSADVRYAVGQGERGEEGTAHIQAYAEWSRAIDFASLKASFEPYGVAPHLEKRKGTRKQARDYCMKDDTYCEDVLNRTEIGEWTGGEVKARACEQAITLAKEGKSFEDALEVIPSWARFARAYDNLLTTYHRPKPIVRTAIWLTGEPGSGKTRAVYDAYGFDNVYQTFTTSAAWFDGYRGERVLLCDDMVPAETRISANNLLRWGDRYPIRANTKGGSIRLEHHIIVVTSNYTIDEFYPSVPDVTRRALKRRYREILVTGELQFGGGVRLPSLGGRGDDSAE